MAAGSGARFELRYDNVNQNQVRSGAGKVASWPAPGHEQELYTRNRYLTAGIDFSASANWGLNLQVPYVDRSHATYGMAFDGSDAGTSHTQSLGDVKLIARYLGLRDEGNTGLQFGLKFPTGSHTQTFSGGAIAGDPLDRGLQPGTGTTDAILGVFHFASWSQNWDYFGQATVQLPLSSSDGYKPGSALNVTAGFRYLGMDSLVPQVQLNARASSRDSGANASPDDSGGKTLYVSPGVSFALGEKAKVYGFLQWPVVQNLNGYQLAPKYTFSVGTQFAF
jgi:hypothetical protein